MKLAPFSLFCFAIASAMAEEVSVLNDHLRLELPNAGVATESPHLLMEAGRHSSEALLCVGSGDKGIIVEVKEKGYLAEDDFVRGVAQAMSHLNEAGDYFTIEQMGDNLVYALLREAPPSPNPNSAYPYGYAEYRHPDGTVQKFSFNVRGGAAGDVQARREDITAWLRSIKPGEGKLNTQARTEKQESYMKDCCVSVPVPEGFYADLNEGEGFHFVQYIRLGKRRAPVEVMSVQVGDHPQLDFRSIPTSRQKVQQGTLAGQKVEWHLFEKDGLLFAECALPLGPRGGKVTFSARTWSWAGGQETINLHITVIAEQEEARADLLRQAEHITLTPTEE